ncbi:MAG: hypothetical protein AAGA68_25125 [Pseudomonadota bacterium]
MSNTTEDYVIRLSPEAVEDIRARLRAATEAITQIDMMLKAAEDGVAVSRLAKQRMEEAGLGGDEK